MIKTTMKDELKVNENNEIITAKQLVKQQTLSRVHALYDSFMSEVEEPFKKSQRVLLDETVYGYRLSLEEFYDFRDTMMDISNDISKLIIKVTNDLIHMNEANHEIDKLQYHILSFESRYDVVFLELFDEAI